MAWDFSHAHRWCAALGVGAPIPRPIGNGDMTEENKPPADSQDIDEPLGSADPLMAQAILIGAGGSTVLAVTLLTGSEVAAALALARNAAQTGMFAFLAALIMKFILYDVPLKEWYDRLLLRLVPALAFSTVLASYVFLFGAITIFGYDGTTTSTSDAVKIELYFLSSDADQP